MEYVLMRQINRKSPLFFHNLSSSPASRTVESELVEVIFYHRMLIPWKSCNESDTHFVLKYRNSLLSFYAQYNRLSVKYFVNVKLNILEKSLLN